MNIQIKSGPELIKPSNVRAEVQQSARERAIQKLMQAPEAPTQTPTNHAVPNPSQISPEELSAVKAPTGQPHSSETQVPAADTQTPTPESPKADPLSQQYALLARKEKALRLKVQQAQAEAKAKEDALAAREAAFAAKESEYQSKYIQKDRFSQDPLSALAELGVSPDQLAQQLLNGSKPENTEQFREFQALKSELQEIKAAQEATRKAQEQQQTESYQQALAQIRRDAARLVQDNPAYETIKETKQVGEIVRLITEVYEKDGYVMDLDDAARMVEDELVDRILSTAKINKIKSKLEPVFRPQVSQSRPQQSPVQQQQSQQPKTLTNSMNSTRKLSARERAILAMQGKLTN